MHSIVVKLSNFRSGEIFGSDLSKVEVGKNGIPDFVDSIMDEIYKRCKIEGIFRISGNDMVIKKIREQINAMEEIDYSSVEVFDLASLMKLYFRSLPNGGIIPSLYNAQIPYLISKYLVLTYS